MLGKYIVCSRRERLAGHGDWTIMVILHYTWQSHSDAMATMYAASTHQHEQVAVQGRHW